MAIKSGYLKISAPIRSGPLRKKLLALMSEKETMREVHAELKDFVEPYVPERTGGLKENVHVVPSGVIYESPYSHYQFEGEVYGPNMPVSIEGNPEWRSKRPKYPMGRKLGSKTGVVYIKPWRVRIDGSWHRAGKDEPALPYVFGYTTAGTTYQWLDAAMRNGGKRRFSRLATKVMKQRARRMGKTW